MYHARLAHSILQRLEQAFPQKVNLPQLKAALPNCARVPDQDGRAAAAPGIRGRGANGNHEGITGVHVPFVG
jgi:hypothetical protein